MTIDISNNTPRISYSVAAGVTQTSFAVPFEFFADTDLNVYVNEVLQTITTNYTVSGGDGSTGTVTMTVTGAKTVIITRDTTIERTTDFTAGVDINRAALNTQLDTLTAIGADVKDLAERAIRIKDFDPSTASLELPAASVRADKLLSFDTEGNVQTQSAADLLTGSVLGANYTKASHTGDGTTVAFSTTEAAGSKNNIQVYIDGVYQNKDTFSISGSTLTFTEAPPLNSAIEFIVGNAVTSLTTDPAVVTYNQGGTGAQDRTLTSRLQDFVSVKDFGAVCDGTTDDFAAIRNALHYLWDQGGGTLLINGPCGISKQLKFDTHDFIPSNPLGGGGDGKSVDVGVYSDPDVPSITIIGNTRPAALNSGNNPVVKPSGFYWLGTASSPKDDMIKITGDQYASWRGNLVFKNLMLDGGDYTNFSNSANSAIDGIWVEQRCNRGCIFEDLVITKCNKTGLRFGTNDASSNNIFSNIVNRVHTNYNGEYGIVVKGNDNSYIACNVERNALDGVVFRKFNNNNRFYGGAIQYNARHQVAFEGAIQQVTLKDVYFEGVNQNTHNAVTSAGNSFFTTDDTSGDISSVTIDSCRFVHGGDATVEEDYIFDLNSDIFGFSFTRNQLNCSNATIINVSSGTFNNSTYFGNQFPSGQGIVEYDSTATRDMFNLFIDKSGNLFNEGKTTTTGSFTMTGTGFSASTTATAYYQIDQDVVHVSMPDLSGTSNATTFTITGFPSAIRPDGDRQFAARWSTDNGTNIDTARGVLSSAGVMTMYKDASTSSNNTWTSSGIKRLRNGEFSYKLNRS